MRGRAAHRRRESATTRHLAGFESNQIAAQIISKDPGRFGGCVLWSDGLLPFVLLSAEDRGLAALRTRMNALRGPAMNTKTKGSRNERRTRGLLEAADLISG